MKYALVTGGLGFIGSHISRELLHGGHVDKVVCLDHFGIYVDVMQPLFTDYRRKRVEDIVERIIVERGEAKYFSVLVDVIHKYRPEYIFHLAALPLAKLSNLNTEEAMEGSVQSTSYLLEVIGHLKRSYDICPRRFVYASSSMVYGDFQVEVATEEHPTRPKEIYGTMKLAGEVVTKGLAGFFGIPYTIIRPSAVYGPTDMNRRVSQIFIEKALLGERLAIHGADERLDFTYVKDVARGFVLAAIHENGLNETFNITHGKSATLLDFVLCLKKHFPDLRYDIKERDEFRPKRGTLSIDKAKDKLNYQPEYTLQDGVDEYVSFLKENLQLLQRE